MAQRRMFSKDIVSSDAFLDMPPTTQLLYFHLGMEADDDGFIGSPKKIARMINSPDDDLKILIGKRFILLFPNGIVVIKHWKINNYIQNDRYHETKYLNEKKEIITKENGSYTEKNKECIQNGYRMDTEVRVRLGKDRQEQGKSKTISSEQSSQVKEIMNIFYKINPTLNWGNKTTRNACEDLIKRFGFEGTVKMAKAVVAVQGQKFAPVATTPYEMKEKLAKFKIYFDNQKNNKSKIINL